MSVDDSVAITGYYYSKMDQGRLLSERACHEVMTGDPSYTVVWVTGHSWLSLADNDFHFRELITFNPRTVIMSERLPSSSKESIGKLGRLCGIRQLCSETMLY